MLKTGNLAVVKYHKEPAVPEEGWESVPDRVIVPTSVPGTNVKAIDVTELSDEKQQEIATLVEEYNEYLTRHMKTAFSFADFCEHTYQLHLGDVKWRTFKQHQLEETQ